MIYQCCPACGLENDTGSRNCVGCGETTVIVSRPGPDEPSSAPDQLEASPSLASGTKFEPRIISTFADLLYVRADWIVLKWTVVGGATGAILLGFYGKALGLLIGGVIGGFAGYREGQARSFLLRLQAQLALCMVEIEANTRRQA